MTTTKNTEEQNYYLVHYVLIDLYLVNRLSLDTKLVLTIVGTFLLAYIFTFPTGWLISDEYSNFNKGIALANGEKSLPLKSANTDKKTYTSRIDEMINANYEKEK